jgi:hypothetical protein
MFGSHLLVASPLRGWGVSILSTYLRSSRQCACTFEVWDAKHRVRAGDERARSPVGRRRPRGAPLSAGAPRCRDDWSAATEGRVAALVHRVWCRFWWRFTDQIWQLPVVRVARRLYAQCSDSGTCDQVPVDVKLSSGGAPDARPAHRTSN